MNNIPINEAETIFEPFWDSGESYPCKRKYSVIANYTLWKHERAIGEIKKTWCNVSMEVEQGVGIEKPACSMSRDCQIDITGYDIFKMNASVAEHVRVTVDCEIDGQLIRVLDFYGLNENHEMDGKISGKTITKITISSYCEKGGAARFYWMGLANEQKQKEMEQRKSGYSTEWEGCFEEAPKSLNPRIGMLMSVNDLETVREKVKQPPMSLLYEGIKQKAIGYLDRVPEEDIGEFVFSADIRWIRDRDRGRESPVDMMKTLAFVGAVEQDEAMLRLACRAALSVACTKNWCEGIMGAFPGATWHHRSFHEDGLLSACAFVLDLAGNLLTWHGRNIIHNAMILKGLSRMEADFHLMEYIHHMNQGIVFCMGRISALIALSYDYPRYRSRVDEAEKVLQDALENYIYPDGGTPEGPGYWNYTISEAMLSYYLLAKYRKQKFEDYLPECMIKTERYGLAMLSTIEDGTNFMAVNDAHGGRYALWIAAVYSRVGEHQERWQELYDKYWERGDVSKALNLFNILLGDSPNPCEKEYLSRPSFWNLMDIGQVSYISETKDVEMIHFHTISGPNFFSHCHSDNGSISLEAGREVLLMERGMCSYSSPYTAEMQIAKSHNIFFPINPKGISYDQKSTGGSNITASRLEDGIWMYTADLTGTWKKGLYARNYRRIFSPDPHLYVVMDEVTYLKPHASAFLFCACEQVTLEEQGVCIQGEKAQARVLPLNWQGDVSCEPFGEEHGKEVTRVWMKTEVSSAHKAITVIEVSESGNSKVVLDQDSILLGEIQLTAKETDQGFEIAMGEKKFVAQGDDWKIK